jgi:hypothetical protein
MLSEKHKGTILHNCQDVHLHYKLRCEFVYIFKNVFLLWKFQPLHMNSQCQRHTYLQMDIGITEAMIKSFNTYFPNSLFMPITLLFI